MSAFHRKFTFPAFNDNVCGATLKAMKPNVGRIRAGACVAALTLCWGAMAFAGIEGQSQAPVGPESDVKVWQAQSPLTWDDFQAQPSSSAFAAQTVWTWSLQSPAVIACVPDQERAWNCTARLERVLVQTLFLKSFSWVKSIAKGNAALLAHEQGHFDLAEVFARRAARSLEPLAASASSDERLDAENQALEQFQQRVNRMVETWLQPAQTEQDRYDRETRHGTDRSQQFRWTSSIQAWLAQPQ